MFHNTEEEAHQMEENLEKLLGSRDEVGLVDKRVEHRELQRG